MRTVEAKILMIYIVARGNYRTSFATRNRIETHEKEKETDMIS